MTHGDEVPGAVDEPAVVDVLVLGATAPVEPVPAPARRRSTRWRVALIVAVVVALLVPVAAFAQRRLPARTGAGAAPSASPSASLTPEQATYLRLRAVLDSQTKALLGGDLDGFLAPVDRSNFELRASLTRRFNGLRALGVARWVEDPAGIPARGDDGLWTLPLSVRYCFFSPQCGPTAMVVPTRWAVEGTKVTLTEFGVSEKGGPRPWEVSDLHVVVGKRVVLVATSRYESRLAQGIVEADKAAEVVERYAKWGPPPDRYIVYLAGPNDWATWYGGKQDKWVAGYAIPTDANTFEVVANGASDTAGDLGDLLRHELAHVVTLAGGDRAGQWWLVEGIAEYVRIVGGGIAFDGLAEVRRYVRSGRWSGDVALSDRPADGMSGEDVSGRYGIAYLAVRHIADRFGEDKMLEFFNQAQRRGLTLETAAQSALGTDWATVAADCAKDVRSKA